MNNIVNVWKLEVVRAIADENLSVFDNDSVPDEKARKAAYYLASCIGKCRLFDIDLGEEDGTVPVEIALAAAEQWAIYLMQTNRSVLNLPFDEDSVETVIDVLASRMEYWGTFLALDEAYQEAVETRMPVSALRVSLNKCLDCLDDLDDTMRHHARFFKMVNASNMLNNWKTHMHQDYKRDLPWWLI